MRVAMIGTGYVGLVSGVCLSDFGHQVTCVDLDKEKIRQLEAGHVPIYEPGLSDMMVRNVADGRLNFTTDLSAAVKQANVVFIAVGTPTRRGDGHADLTYVHAAARDIARHLHGHTVVIIKSTVPVGTNAAVKQIISEANPDADFDICSNPEFLREGAAIEDFMRPDRVVIGLENSVQGPARDAMAELYAPLSLRDAPIMFTDLASAELIKYAANAFLATKITFINEIAVLAENVGADIQEIAKGMGLDKRIGPKFLNPGPGYGGSCFPKDTTALARIGQEHASPMRIVETVIEVNEIIKRRMISKIGDLLDNKLAGRRIAVLGATFKPETDDMRAAPSLTIIPALIGAGAEVRVTDPKGEHEGAALLPGAIWCKNAYEAADKADAIVLLTEWNAFRALDLKRLASVMTEPRMADLRNVYSEPIMKAAGFTYSNLHSSPWADKG